MARIYLPSSTPPKDEAKPKPDPVVEQQPESTPQGALQKLAEPAAAAAPPASASKADWVDYAVTYRGADRDKAEAMTRNALAEKYGGS